MHKFITLDTLSVGNSGYQLHSGTKVKDSVKETHNYVNFPIVKYTSASFSLVNDTLMRSRSITKDHFKRQKSVRFKSVSVLKVRTYLGYFNFFNNILIIMKYERYNAGKVSANILLM